MLTPYCCLTCYYHNISGKFIRTNANSFDTLLAMAIGEGVQTNKNTFFGVFFYKGGGGVGGDVKEQLAVFMNHVFVGMFQYDSGTQNML